MDRTNEQVDAAAGRRVSLADMVSDEDAPVSILASPAWSSWLKVAVLAVLCGAFYWTQLRQLVNQWLADVNWSHGFIIPLFSLFMLYNWRRRLFQAPREVCMWGWAFILLAVLVKAGGVLVLHNAWIPQLSITIMIFGLVMYLGGWRIARIAFVPIFYLTLAMPWPDMLYQMISTPMQDLAAASSTVLLQFFGVKMTVSASFLKVTSISGQVHPIQVAEACSGMRSLMAFIALGVAMAYIEDRPFWQRLIIMVGGVPIALACNILRVTGTCTMFVIDKRELGEDFMHNAMGMVLLIPALLLLMLLTRLLNSIYVDVDEDEEDASADVDGANSQAPEVQA